jgi:hypothetical protein
LLCGLVLASVLAACSPPDRAIVAEVFYDAAGDDTGFEFVELFNPTPHPVALNGARLEAGDGAGAARWTLRWTGTATDSIAAGARFLIGGALVMPPPNVVVTLALQNGPDAVRLVWPDGAIEVVGYGALGLPEYFCGAPAADVASGFSLARVPDASDLGSNAADFRAASPSPGRANQAHRDLAVVPGSLTLAPPRPAPDEPLVASARLTNAGADTIRLGDVVLSAEIEDLDASSSVARTHRSRRASGTSRVAPPSAANPPVIGPLVVLPGDTLAFDLPIDPLPAGRYRLAAVATVPGDENAADDRDTLRLRVGPGPLAVTEIQFHPADGEGEWVEVRNRSGIAIDLTTFTLSDRGTARGVPREGDGALAPESLAVLAQNRAALLAAYPGLAAARVWEVSPWAALNNSDDAGGVADEVVLREADGLEDDRVAYHAGGLPAGVPLELRDGAWVAALDPRGTPLAPPKTLPPAAHRFELAPARVPAGDVRVAITWALPWPRAEVRADLYDLEGRRVAALLPERSAAGRGTRELTLAGAPAGVYWVVLEARATGGERFTDSRPLRIVGVAR